ncbi:MAG: hypothetical protein IJZ31_02035 [Bacteroidaceae bacterium]|nr:hypothetical protein [Bacteroidaceae bacterium]
MDAKCSNWRMWHAATPHAEPVEEKSVWCRAELRDAKVGVIPESAKIKMKE